MTNDTLYTMPKNVQTRWASAENWDGAKGAAGQANRGRKGSAWFPLKAGEQKVLAHAENSYGLFERRDDWSSCAWFYLDRPTNDLPPLAPVAERTVGLLGSEEATKRADA